jgi:flavin-dependent thymidylate synthase
MTKDVLRWGDSAMYESEKMPEERPSVFFLQGTPDPLGSIAAFSAMYIGKVVRDKREVTDEERRYYLEEMKKTKLKAPLEAVNLHFMIEGVTRSFTHQMVRQRTAVYAQESLRFAVKDEGAIISETALPPSIAGTEGLGEGDNLVMGGERDKSTWQRNVWDNALAAIDEAYDHLIQSGMPAEDARGLLPHNITTRLNYATNLRNLQDHAGNRLCTQAQFEWRMFWVRLIESMRAYCTFGEHEADTNGKRHHSELCDNWQWQEIANLFRPVCYLTGKCEFKAKFDRACTIRERVDANEAVGRKSEVWHMAMNHTSASQRDFTDSEVIWEPDGMDLEGEESGRPVFIGAISPAEWLLDDGAARVKR